MTGSSVPNLAKAQLSHRPDAGRDNSHTSTIPGNDKRSSGGGGGKHQHHQKQQIKRTTSALRFALQNYTDARWVMQVVFPGRLCLAATLLPFPGCTAASTTLVAAFVVLLFCRGAFVPEAKWEVYGNEALHVEIQEAKRN